MYELVFVACGILFGIITGLIPGIHINLVSAVILGSIGYFSNINPIYLAIFIISMGITHTFLDSIPSIYIGAPDGGMELGVLPGHRMLLEGRGYEAVMQTVFGSLFAVVFGVILFPIFLFLLNYYEFIPITEILIFVVVFMILNQKNVFLGALIFVLSGVLGFLVFEKLSNGLFPLLSGLFGISTLLLSQNNLPEQKITTTHFELKKELFLAQFTGFLTAVLPGLGSSMAAILASQFSKVETENFLAMLGVINTSNFMLSLATLYVVDKARNGAIIVVQELTSINENIVALLLVCLFVGCIAVFISRFFAKHFVKFVKNYSLVKRIVIGLIVLLTFILTGGIGGLVLFCATLIGILTQKLNVSRTLCMGCIMLPVMLYFI